MGIILHDAVHNGLLALKFVLSEGRMVLSVRTAGTAHQFGVLGLAA